MDSGTGGGLWDLCLAFRDLPRDTEFDVQVPCFAVDEINGGDEK